MITKQQFIESLMGELSIVRHLGTKITPEMLEYRPHEKQRTMLELMQYLSHAFETGMTGSINGGDGPYFGGLAAKAPRVTLETFDFVMEAQINSIRTMLEPLTEEDLAKETELFGRKAPIGVHMLGVMKWVVAYKMQLFLYIKACGNHDINTSNLWRGVDPAPKM